MSGNYRDYIFGNVPDNERQQLQFKAFQPDFNKLIERLLDQYGLADRLKAAQAQGQKLRFLQVACGEGHYLHELAAILEKRGLLNAAELNGIDSQPGLIAVADEFRLLSKPPRPYLNFLVYNLSEPLEKSVGLARQGQAKFDLIFVIQTTQHIPQAEQFIARLYNSLTPGGLIFLRDMRLAEGPEGWLNPYPSVQKVSQLIFDLMLKQTGGIVVADHAAEWLRDLGAEQVEAFVVKKASGGETENGKLVLRQNMMSFYLARPMLIGRKIMTEAEFDAMMKQFYQEVTRDRVGQSTYVDTVGRKPDTI